MYNIKNIIEFKKVNDFFELVFIQNFLEFELCVKDYFFSSNNRSRSIGFKLFEWFYYMNLFNMVVNKSQRNCDVIIIN